LKPCHACDGEGAISWGVPPIPCGACKGSGRASSPAPTPDPDFDSIPLTESPHERWLNDHFAELPQYAGETIAVHGTRGVVAHGRDFAKLCDDVRAMGLLSEVLLSDVPEAPPGAQDTIGGPRAAAMGQESSEPVLGAPWRPCELCRGRPVVSRPAGDPPAVFPWCSRCGGTGNENAR
jgi:hypothetical protein